MGRVFERNKTSKIGCLGDMGARERRETWGWLKEGRIKGESGT